MNELTKLSQIKTYTKSKLGTDKTGHGYDHIKRVVTMAEKILESEAADKLVTLAAAYLHDTIDDKLVSDPKSALAELQEFLASCTICPDRGSWKSSSCSERAKDICVMIKLISSICAEVNSKDARNS